MLIHALKFQTIILCVALNACFFSFTHCRCVANHVRAHIAQLEHKYLSILGISVRAEWVYSLLFKMLMLRPLMFGQIGLC